MLKITLLTAAAAFVITAAAPISSFAQGSGLRQIVVDPSAKSGGGGDGSGGGQGTGGGGGAGTGGGKNKKLVIEPLVADPNGTASVDSTPGAGAVDTGAPAGGDKAKGPEPVATLGDQPGAGKADPLDTIIGKPAAVTGSADKLDAITGDQSGAAGAAPIVVPADQGGAPAAVAKVEGGAPAGAVKVEGAPIKDVGGLIVALKTSGFEADIDHRDNKGDYYVVVTTPKDHSFGYLLTVDDKNGKVLEKKKIDPTEYGYYADSKDYGKPKGYDQPDSGYTDDNSYGGDDSYSGNSGGGGYGSSGGSGY